MARQLTFDLPAKPALGREDFFVSPANRHAVEVIESWRHWPQRKLVLVGPEGSGKTHLAHVWATLAGARIIAAHDLPVSDIAAMTRSGPAIVVEDIDGIASQLDAERALFHVHNHLLAEGGALLLTGTGTPSQWPFRLPDLASRVQGSDLARLEPPDDDLLRAVLVKLFADRQLTVGPAVIDYVLQRMERRLNEAARLVDLLDRAGLSQRRPITRVLAASVLDKNP
jgi:DnaA regulatory inactivator Hda